MSSPLDESDDELRYYTPSQVAELFQVTPETIRNWIKDNKIKAVMFGQHYRISRTELKRFANERHGPIVK